MFYGARDMLRAFFEEILNAEGLKEKEDGLYKLENIKISRYDNGNKYGIGRVDG